MAKMAKGEFSHTAIEETQQLIKKPGTEIQEEKKWGVVFPGHNTVKAAIDTYPVMVRDNQMDGCLPGQIGTATIHRHAGDTKAHVYLHHDGHHLGP